MEEFFALCLNEKLTVLEVKSALKNKIFRNMFRLYLKLRLRFQMMFGMEVMLDSYEKMLEVYVTMKIPDANGAFDLDADRELKKCPPGLVVIMHGDGVGEALVSVCEMALACANRGMYGLLLELIDL